MSDAREERFERRLIAWGLGLLSDEETEELRTWWEAVRSPGAPPTGTTPADRHVPTSVLGRWPQLEGRLERLERDLVRRHLERCASCREDLAILESASAGTARLRDAEPGVERGVRRAVASAPIRSIGRHPRFAQWLPWLGGAALGGALAAGLLLAIRPPAREHPEAALPTDGPLCWVTPTFTRGTAPSEARPAVNQPLALALSVPLGFPESDSMQVTVTDPSGAPFAGFAIAPSQVVAGSVLVQLHPRRPGGRWGAGAYQIQVRAGDQSEVGVFVLRPDSVATKAAQ